MNFNRDLLRAAYHEWLLLTLTVLFGLGAGIAIILQARQVSMILARVFIGGLGREAVSHFFLPLFVILLMRALLTFMSDYAAGSLAVKVKNSLRSQLVEHLFDLGPANVRSENSGELTNTVQDGVEALDAYFSQYLPQVALAGLLPLAVLVIVFPMDWLSGLVLLLTAPLIPVFMILIGKASAAATRRQFSGLSRLSAFFLDTLQGLTEIKLLGQSRQHAERITKAADQYRLTTMNVLRVTFLSAFVLEMVGTISTAVIAVEIGLRLLRGGIGFEQAFFILLLAPEFYQPLRMLGQRFHAGANGIAAARRIFTVLDTIPASRATKPAAQIHPTQEKPKRIVFSDVSFTYPGQTTAAVDRVNFEVQAGKMTALVGASGAGKSTIAQLLLGFTAPTEGQILVDQTPLKEVSLPEWRKLITWVPQQPVIFKGTIRENIAFGRPGAPLADCQAAAQLANLHDRICTLERGYETVVGEKGAGLSRGEQQRLALARAFLVDAPVVVLDEPTASLDPVKEALLETALRQLCAGRMVLIIAHRLSTVDNADQILVMDHGRLVEGGTHQSLIQVDGTYRRLVTAFSGGKA